MPNIIVWVVLTFFLLITPKTAFADWNGLSTAGPDFLNSQDGKTWTYEIGNDGRVYTGGEEVNLAFGAYWCRYSNASECDGGFPDFKNVSTLQSFTITAPAPGDSTAPTTKTFTIASTDYPCGRVQADIVPDPNPASDILGGHVYDTGKTCPPDLPENLSASCTAGTGTFNWTSGATKGDTSITDDLRIDYNPVSWSNNCSALNSNDYCFDPASPGKVNNMASGTYDWWVDSCNSGGCKTQHGPNFTCPAACTTSLVAPELSSPTLNQNFSASTTTVTLSWKGVTGADRYQVRVTDDKGTVIVNNQRTTNLSSSVPVTAGRTYVWSVRAIKDATGSCSEVQSPDSTGTFSVDKPDFFITSCVATPSTANTTQGVTWNTTIRQVPFNPPHTFNWTFDTGYSCFDPASGCTSTIDDGSVIVKYTTAGTKAGTVKVTDKSGTSIGPVSCGSVLITAPDLITQNLAYAGDTIVGAAMTFSGKVNNQGDASTGSPGSSFNARFCIDNASCLISTTNRVGGDITVPALPATTLSSPITSSSWTATTGSHTIYFCADVGATVTESNEGLTSNCSQLPFTVSAPGTPAAPTVTTSLSCIPPGYTGSGFTITYGSRTPPVTWANISSSSTFSSYYHKDVTGTTFTTAPNEFNLNPSNPPQPLTLNPDTDYYARVYDGTQNSQVRTFTTPPSCSAAFNYSLTNSGNITLNQGSSGANTITRTLTAGTSQPVDLSASGLPSGASASFTNNPASPPLSSTLTISTLSTTPIGSYNITVTGSPLGKITIFILTVNSSCGNNICEAGETTASCPTDCPPVPGGTCPNKICEAGETTASCPTDCPPGGPVCGDTLCGGPEPVSCPLDCPGPGIRPWIQTTGGDVHSNTGIQ